MDIDSVKQQIKPNTKLISIDFPNNPTGAVLGKDHFKALISLCRGRGIYLFLQKMEHYKHYLSICNSAPSERLAIIALKLRDKVLERNRALVNSNAEKLDMFFNEFPDRFEWYRPDGGCVGFPGYKGLEDANQFCEDLVSRTVVLLLPPKIYNSELLETPQDRFRIGFGRKNIEKGLSVFQRYLLNWGLPMAVFARDEVVGCVPSTVSEEH